MRYTTVGTYRKQYITKANDTFDKIAYDVYGDENIASHIIAVNPEHSATVIFKEGVHLYLPILEVAETSTLPKWKGGV